MGDVHLKSALNMTVQKRTRNALFSSPKSSFGDHKLHGLQTKILEGLSNIRELMFKALFTYVSTRLLLCSPHHYLRFSYAFRPRGESATVCSPQWRLPVGLRFRRGLAQGFALLRVIGGGIPLWTPNEDLGTSKNMWVRHM